MSDDRSIEKRLERYVVGELGDADRRLVEEYLTGTTEDAAKARDDLRFEQALAQVLQGPESSDDLAGAVLDRVYRRLSRRGRQAWQDGVASRLVAERAHAPHPGPGAGARARARSEAIQKLAVLGLFVLVFGTWAILREPNRQHDHGPKESEPTASVGRPLPPGPRRLVTEGQPVANLAYGAAVADDEAGDDLGLVIPESGREVFTGADIETDPSESAVLRLADGGVILLRPSSRVRLQRTAGRARVAVLLDQGGFSYQIPDRGAPMELIAPDGRRSRLQRGSGHVVLAASVASAPGAPAAFPLRQILVIRPGKTGLATLEGGSQPVPVRSGQVGFAGSDTAIALDDRPGPLDRVSFGSAAGPSVPGPLAPFAAFWQPRDVGMPPNTTAFIIGARSYDVAAVAREALRVHSEELIETLTRSIVVQWELRRRGVPVDASDRQDAAFFVANDELQQVSPMRSESGMSERVAACAGLLALRRAAQSKAEVADPRRLSIASEIEGAWRELERGIVLERPTQDADLAFRIRYQGSSLEVRLDEAWDALRRWLTPAEMERVVQDMARRELIVNWLRVRGQDWPRTELPPDRSRALMAHLSGMSRVQLQEMLTIQSLTVGQVPPVVSAEVEAFLGSVAATRNRVVFDHWFFPYRGTDDGRGEVDRDLALAKARALAGEIRKGRGATGGTEIDDSQVGRPWRSGIAGGPRPWWNALYGPDFTRIVLGLPLGEVSDPIAGPEGYHLVQVRHAESVEAGDPALRQSWAAAVLGSERARLQMDDMVRTFVRFGLEPRSLLR